jgi:hypothetical protein
MKTQAVQKEGKYNILYPQVGVCGTSPPPVGIKKSIIEHTYFFT